MANGNRRLMSTLTTAAHSLLDPFLAGAAGVEGSWAKAADAVRTRWVHRHMQESCVLC
jgi:hypothetical protein